MPYSVAGRVPASVVLATHQPACTAATPAAARSASAAVEMPTPFDTFGPAAHHGSSAGTARAREHREVLLQSMVGAGFRPNRMEWWHYDAPERRGAPLLDEALVPAP